jgi:hypothetical protein
MTFAAPAIFEKLMVRAVLNLFHHSTMAVGTESRVISSDCEQLFFIGAVGAMAGIASALAYRFVDICLGKPYFSIRVAGITGYVHSGCEHTRNIRSVGIVTGTAPPLVKGFVHL